MKTVPVHKINTYPKAACRSWGEQGGAVELVVFAHSACGWKWVQVSLESQHTSGSMTTTSRGPSQMAGHSSRCACCRPPHGVLPTAPMWLRSPHRHHAQTKSVNTERQAFVAGLELTGYPCSYAALKRECLQQPVPSNVLVLTLQDWLSVKHVQLCTHHNNFSLFIFVSFHSWAGCSRSRNFPRNFFPRRPSGSCTTSFPRSPPPPASRRVCTGAERLFLIPCSASRLALRGRFFGTSATVVLLLQ